MRRTPWLTLLVAFVTLAGLVLQESVPGTLHALERLPGAQDPWRWLTALLVQDGWLAGGAFNLFGVLVLGATTEQVARRRVWITAYVGAGLVGQVFGHLWQPVGGGNSVANCGLAAVLVVLLARRRAVQLPMQAVAPALWCGVLAALVWWPLGPVGIVVGVAAGASDRAWSAYAVAGFCGTCSIVLLSARDLHGGALATALVVASVPPVTSWLEIGPDLAERAGASV